MKLKHLVFLSLLPCAGFADGGEVNCAYPESKNPALETIKVLSTDMKMQELKELAAKDKEKMVAAYVEYTEKTCSSVSYKISEQALNPGESAYFHVPPEFRDRGVNFMVLGHRQNPKEGDVEGAWDETPGLSSVQVYNDKGAWNYWQGQASGKNGAKFAENRMTAEIENLYDWNHYGHTDLKTGKTSHESLLPEAIKVVSVGKDPVLVSEITLKVDPFKETSKSEEIFSTGTSFSPNDHDKKYTLGGGQAFKGKFPGAKVLTSGTDVRIPLEAGRKITTINVACGDSHPDEKQNSDGGWGTQGWAKMSIGIQKPDGTITWLTKNENVPPEGVLMASPADCDQKIEPGSKVVVKSNVSTLYVMGIHVGYR